MSTPIACNRPLAITLTLLLAPLAACGDNNGPAQPPPAEPVLHTFTSDQNGFDTHSYYLDTGAEVVVFDAQFTPALAQALVDDIRAHTDAPIRYLVVTHPNPDKFNGAPVFQALGARVVASEATAAAIAGVHAYKRNFFVNVAGMFTEETYPAQARVDITFDGELTLDLDAGTEVRLRVLDNPGVSSTQTVASIPALDAVVVGDLIHHQAHAWLEGGIVDGAPRPDLASWRAALDELAVFGNATVYAGRGAVAALDEALPAQKAYLTQVEDITRAYVAEYGTDALLGSDAATHQAAISQRIAAAYPDHALPYMTQFSIYGLATAVASEIAAERQRASR
jgi:glyoxylase-like metal-dependent hydrolase (beta-lactamase superfamily II)